MPDPITRLNAALEGRYCIERQLGEGGMATVYLADDLRHERKVALKVLKPELAAVVGADRFLAEIKTTANLQHPHILPLFDSGEADSFLFYVMPYVEGESLRERLDREHQLPVDKAIKIAAAVANALDYAHRHGVIHRDIKPANILLHDGEPVVSDFGIALALGAAGAGRLTETGLSLGTPHYMSPEQATGDLNVAAATDIYALGCVLYEMLVGEPPYTGSTPQAVLGKIVTGEADPVTKHRRSVPANVDAAIRRALERVPADRFASAGKLAEALADAGFRHGATAVVGAKRSGIWHPVSMGLAGLAAFFAATTVWLAGRTAPAESDARLPVTQFVVQPPAGTTIASNQGFAITPDGRTLLIRATGGLYRRDLGSLESVFIPGTENAWMPFVSPDGEWIAFVDYANGVLERVRLDGSGLQTLSEAPSSGRSGAWSERDTIVFNSDALGGLMRVSATGGTAQPVIAQRSMGWLDLLPGGRQVLGNLPANDYADIGLFSLETGESQPLFPGTMPRYAGGHIVYWREGALWAAPFDLGRLEVTGAHSMLATGVYAGENGIAGFVVANGVLAYQPGTFRSQRFGMPVWVSPEGDEEQLAIEPGLYNWPRISPDGSKIALTRVEGQNQDVWVFDLQTGAPTRITVDQAIDATPVWTADSRRVVFRSERDGPSNLYWRSADASDEVTRLTDQPMQQRPVSVTTDGVLLFEDLGEVFAGVDAEGVDVWSMRLESGEQPSRVFAESFNESKPMVSPDGTLIAYQSTELGYPEIFVRSFPELIGARMVSVLDIGMQIEGSNADAREARAPVWSRDGATLYYRSGTAIVGVPVGGGGTPGIPRIVFRGSSWPFVSEGRHYDVHPDGRFIRIKLEPLGDTRPNELVVVMNWQSLLDES